MKINRDKMQWHWDQYKAHSKTAREHLKAATVAIAGHNHDAYQTHFDAYLAESKIANRHFGTYRAMQTKLTCSYTR